MIPGAKVTVQSTICASLIALAPLSSQAQEPSEAAAEFVHGNVLSIFYHEFGHALIDILGMPVIGREEDAADALSVVLTNEMWEEDAAASTAWVTAEYWLQSASDTADDDPAYADVHGLDMQRHFTHVCLFYGANPDARGEFVTAFDLPQERAEGCAEVNAFYESQTRTITFCTEYVDYLWDKAEALDL